MPMTPAAAARARKMAALQSKNAAPTRAEMNITQQMLAMMYEHKRTLKKIQSISQKGYKKAEFFLDYEPYISGVLKADSGQQDEVITTLTLWAIDAKLIDQAIVLSSYVMRHGLTIPDKFTRTMNVVIAEQISELALKDASPVKPEHLTALYELVGETDMPDQVRVKLEKACGLGLMESSPETALYHLKKAIDLNGKAGVKPQIKALEKLIQDSASGDTPEA